MKRRNVPLPLRPKDIVEGHFTVRGLRDSVIIFYIEDPEGNTIYKPSDWVVGYDSFRFRATMDGEYFLCFDNIYLLLKTVYLTIEIYSELCPIMQFTGGV